MSHRNPAFRCVWHLAKCTTIRNYATSSYRLWLSHVYCNACSNVKSKRGLRWLSTLAARVARAAGLILRNFHINCVSPLGWKGLNTPQEAVSSNSPMISPPEQLSVQFLEPFCAQGRATATTWSAVIAALAWKLTKKVQSVVPQNLFGPICYWNPKLNLAPVYDSLNGILGFCQYINPKSPSLQKSAYSVLNIPITYSGMNRFRDILT